MVKNMNNIIVIGDLNYNLNIFLNTFLKENNEYTINNITKSIGNILNVPIVLSKYDLNVYYFSCVGNDIEGKEIINFLHSNKIRSDYVNILNKKTNNKYIIRNKKNNSKTILSLKNNDKYELIRSINFIPNVVYSTIYNSEFILNIKSKFRSTKIITDLKEISEESIKVCKLSDYVIIPLKYAQVLTGINLNIANKNSIIELYSRTKRLFSGKIIIYIEEVGCLFQNNNLISIIPKMGDKNKVSKSSYDMFISTFIYCINKDYALDKTVKISTISKFLSDNGKQTFNIKEVLDIYEKNN